MVKVTLEVPESLLGDIYIAVGKVLENDRFEAEEGAEQPAAPECTDSDQSAAED